MNRILLIAVLLVSSCEPSSNPTETIEKIPTPSISISSSMVGVATATEFTITWSSTDATSCLASGDWAETKATTGTQILSETAIGEKTYTLTCTGVGGSTSQSIAVTVANIPTVSIESSAEFTLPGSIYTLSWSSTDTTSCLASGDWTGTKATTGTDTVSEPAAGEKNYILTCSGVGGSTSQSIAVIVANIPTVTIESSAEFTLPGSAYILSWLSTDATSCLASGDWTGTKPTTGTQTLSEAAAGGKTYIITCSGVGGSASQSVAVTVATIPTVTIESSAELTLPGSAYTLSWSSTDATSCSASGDWTGTKPTAGTQSLSEAAATEKTYTLTCSGVGGSTSQSIAVTIANIPIVTISSSTASTLPGSAYTLSWSSTDATSCLASGDWAGTKPAAGTQTISESTAGGKNVYHNVLWRRW